MNEKSNKAILVSASLKTEDSSSLKTSLQELGRLAQTAGLDPVAHIEARRQKWDPSTFIGQGKAEELKQLVMQTGAEIVIFDEELTPAQQRNLEKILGGITVSTRTRLIISIFSGRARTREGRLQADLAELSYELTRLTGKGLGMDQQHGMIGGRGAGEKKKEYDRRTLRDKISELKKKINEIKKERVVQRAARNSVPLPQISIVGYTNAGKSTFLNTVTNNAHSIYADDKLFATLDPSVKRVKLPSGGEALFTDTVGFIQRLPHQLIAAFRSTLEEIRFSDVILHIHDYSSPDAKLQHEAVRATLQEIEVQDIPVINVFNKCDAVRDRIKAWAPVSLRPVFISAMTGEGIPELLLKCEQVLSLRWKEYTEIIPTGKKHLLNFLYSCCMVKKTDYTEQGAAVTFRATQENYSRLKKHLSE
ncbi:MAG: GTPase HflX [Elusimicrobiales bacterium]|nr:GTPase HflX [Elusimicrobiales bacterium]